MPRFNILRDFTDKGCDLSLRNPVEIDKDGKIKDQSSKKKVIKEEPSRDDGLDEEKELEVREDLDDDDDGCDVCDRDPCVCVAVIPEPEPKIVEKPAAKPKKKTTKKSSKKKSNK